MLDEHGRGPSRSRGRTTPDPGRARGLDPEQQLVPLNQVLTSRRWVVGLRPEVGDPRDQSVGNPEEDDRVAVLTVAKSVPVEPHYAAPSSSATTIFGARCQSPGYSRVELDVPVASEDPLAGLWDLVRDLRVEVCRRDRSSPEPRAPPRSARPTCGCPSSSRSAVFQRRVDGAREINGGLRQRSTKWSDDVVAVPATITSPDQTMVGTCATSVPPTPRRRSKGV